MSKATVKLKGTFNRIEKVIGETIQPANIRLTARFARDLIVKRTRLGYGVNKEFAAKSKLNALDYNNPENPRYKTFRKTFKFLDRSTTTPNKSNLTLTGQMLASVDIVDEQRRTISTKITLAPKGNRWDISESNADISESNADIAKYNAEKGRTFMNVSELEYRQILRFYRKSFADLFRKRSVLK